VRLAVGDVVVYTAYGVGRIVAREKRVVTGADQEIVVLELAAGLTVTLPLDRAARQLRPPFDEADMRRVQQTLREAGAVSGDVWLKRRKDTQAKLKGGDPVELAEVVRDGAQRVRDLAARPSKPQLSPAERDLYVRARRLLSEELRVVRGLEQAEADTWIEEQLERAS
jgi:CarD family transcriptional regulator, regulator of rRNA transcription